MSRPSPFLVLVRHLRESVLYHTGARRLQFARNRRLLAAAVAADRPHIGRVPGAGVRLLIDPQMYMVRAYTQELFELPVVTFLRDWLRKGDVFVDVGANVGLFTVLGACCVGPHGRVIAFEPGRFVSDLLRRNCEINGLHWVQCEQLALSDRTGSLELHEGAPGYDAFSSLGRVVHGSAVGGEFSTVSVPVACGDDWWAAHGKGRIRLMKIDVEGAELDVIRGFRELLASGNVEALLVEITDEMAQACGHTARAVWEALLELGYDWWRLAGYGALEPLGEFDPRETMFLALPRRGNGLSH